MCIHALLSAEKLMDGTDLCIVVYSGDQSSKDTILKKVQVFIFKSQLGSPLFMKL